MYSARRLGGVAVDAVAVAAAVAVAVAVAVATQKDAGCSDAGAEKTKLVSGPKTSN